MKDGARSTEQICTNFYKSFLWEWSEIRQDQRHSIIQKRRVIQTGILPN